MTNLIFLLILLVLGYGFGRLAEKRHYRSILQREQQYRELPAFASKLPSTLNIHATDSALVYGSTVVSVDYFKQFVAGLRALVGGRLKTYESLLDRARREAILRMKEHASEMGANMIVNLKLESSRISSGGRGSVGTLEVLAYGTALIAAKEHAVTPFAVEMEMPAGINISNDSPLKEFAFLGTGIAFGLSLLFLIFILIADFLVPLVPFKVEQKFAATFESHMVEQSPPSPMTNYLQTLADKISIAQELPATMDLKIHYIEDDTVNAFATLGGHVLMFRGLLEKLPNENALTMLLAHEIAHIKHRHPIKSLGRSVVIATTMALIGGATSSDVGGQVLGETGLLTILKFSRDHEQNADYTALATLFSLYGHVDGAESLFSALTSNSNAPPAFFSTHPGTENRINENINFANMQSWPTTGSVTALPAEFKTWLSTEQKPTSVKK